jgi:hypothetical protein
VFLPRFEDIWSSREGCQQKINREQRQGSDSEDLGKPDQVHKHPEQPEQ